MKLKNAQHSGFLVARSAIISNVAGQHVQEGGSADQSHKDNPMFSPPEEPSPVTSTHYSLARAEHVVPPRRGQEVPS